jgi:hypothetical protein
MIDFEKIREENKKKAEAAIASAPATIIRQEKPDYLRRLNHLIEYHLGVMTEWEANFAYSTKEFMINTDAVKNGKPEMLEHILTEKVKNKIAELEASFCNQMCHALMAAGVPHA